MTIYDIKKDYQAFVDMVMDLQDTLEEEGRDITEEEEKILMEFFNENDGNFIEKLDNYGRIIKNIEANIIPIENELKRLQKKKRSFERIVSRLKLNIFYLFRQMRIKEKKTNIFKFNIQKNAPSLVIDDPSKIPEFYIKPQDPVYDTAQIKKDLKDGMKLDFCHLEQSESLRIR